MSSGRKKFSVVQGGKGKPANSRPFLVNPAAAQPLAAALETAGNPQAAKALLAKLPPAIASATPSALRPTPIQDLPTPKI